MTTTTSKKIRAAMIMAGVTGAQLARQEKVTRSAINHMVTGCSKSARLRRAISRACKLPLNIWGELDQELSSRKKTS